MILSAFWPFIAWMESTTYLGSVISPPPSILSYWNPYRLFLVRVWWGKGRLMAIGLISPADPPVASLGAEPDSNPRRLWGGRLTPCLKRERKVVVWSLLGIKPPNGSTCGAGWEPSTSFSPKTYNSIGSPHPEASLYLMFRSPKIRLYLYQNHRRKIVNSTLFQVIWTKYRA